MAKKKHKKSKWHKHHTVSSGIKEHPILVPGLLATIIILIGIIIFVLTVASRSQESDQSYTVTFSVQQQKNMQNKLLGPQSKPTTQTQ